MRLIRIVAEVARRRGQSTEELINSIGGPAESVPEPAAPASVTAVRVVQRLLCGLHNPLRETARTVAVLRALGYPAELVVGYEPVPVAGDRRLFTWIEIGGQVRGTSMPAHTFYPQLWRFPA